eukprot:scaffold79_cov259-Pinguiococcus_pyrenoidosus.AAC.39
MCAGVNLAFHSFSTRSRKAPWQAWNLSAASTVISTLRRVVDEQPQLLFRVRRRRQHLLDVVVDLKDLGHDLHALLKEASDQGVHGLPGPLMNGRFHPLRVHLHARDENHVVADMADVVVRTEVLAHAIKVGLRSIQVHRRQEASTVCKGLGVNRSEIG